MAPRIRNSAYVLNLIPRESSYRLRASSQSHDAGAHEIVGLDVGRDAQLQARGVNPDAREDSSTIASRSVCGDFRGDVFRIFSLETAACPCLMAFALVRWVRDESFTPNRRASGVPFDFYSQVIDIYAFIISKTEGKRGVASILPSNRPIL